MRAVLWGVGGFLGGGLLAGVIGIILPGIFSISQAEGAYAMGIAFFWVPAAAIVGGIAGAVYGVWPR